MTDTELLLTDDMREAPRPAHSPLGASGAERWMNCPGSVRLLQLLNMDESDEPDYRREGTAMHEAAAHALINGLDAWELVSMTFFDTAMTPALCDPLQIYLDYVRGLHGRPLIEYQISSPVHPSFYGTTDFGAINPGLIHVVDLKGGEGIAVEVEWNPQIMYYGFGLVDGEERRTGQPIDDNVRVRFAIVQPRWWDDEDRIREWECSVGELKAWVQDTLLPAMRAVEYDDRLLAGDWCRFCPAKLVCPLLTALFKAAAVHNAKDVVNLSDEQLGRDYALAQAVKFYIKAQELEVAARLMKGRDVEGTKLVRKKSNRVWKDGAFDIAKAKFGKDAWTLPEAKSPAELEKLPAAKDWVKEFAYAPDTGLTVALANDKRHGISVPSAVTVFAAAAAALDTPADAS